MKMNETAKVMGSFRVVHKDVAGKVISDEVFENLVTDEGFDYLLNSSLHGTAAISDWYFAPWSTNTAADVGHTYAVPVNTEATTDINEALRQAWGEGASSSQSITNASAATITATGAVTIYGIGIVGGGSVPTTKGDVGGGGTLFSTALFGAGKVLATSETLDLTYTVSKA